MRDRLENKIDSLDRSSILKGLKKNWDFLAVAGIFIIAVWLRYIPVNAMQYIQALDPYMGFRISQHLAYEGSIPVLDFMRYFPFATPGYHEQFGALFFPAALYWLGPFLVFENFLGWAQFYPALMGGLAVVFAYLFGKEVWNKTAGVSGAFFLATIAGSMHRTSAGWFIKEAAAVMFMMASLYFFVRAWKRNDWLSGILSGFALGGMTITWGGSSMLWLLYPLTVGTVLLLDEDINGLISSYTPTIIIASGLALTLDYSNFWFTSTEFLVNIALLGFLWSRKVVEEFGIIDQNYIPYYAPGMTVLGLIGAALSPLYSNFVASNILSVYRRVIRPTGRGTIGGTVAENQAPTIGQLISQFGALSSAQIEPVLGLFSNMVGPWPLTFVGIAFLGTTIGFMLARKFGFVEEVVDGKTYLYGFGVAFLTWIIVFSAFFQFSVGQSPLFAIIPSALGVIGGVIMVHSFEGYTNHSVDFKWYYFLPFFWVLSNVISAVGMSRLVFLGSFPVAVIAGYMLSIVLRKIPELELSEIFESVNQGRMVAASLIIVVVPLVVVNIASGYAAVQGIGGSPNELWMESLEWMDEETDDGEVMMSWWDYGYHFQTIGRSPSVADGGNYRYFTDESEGRLPFQLADFFTSENPENHSDLFERHSVDYIVLDNTMVGKYSAVSQIANRDNENFDQMIQLESQGVNIEEDSETITTFRARGLQVHVPLGLEDNTVEFAGAPTFDVRGQRVPVDCALTDEGRIDFEVDAIETSGYCIAEDPFLGFDQSHQFGIPSQIVLVPESIANESIVRLYLMDGYGMDFVERVPEASNGFVEVWDVDRDEI